MTKIKISLFLITFFTLIPSILKGQDKAINFDGSNDYILIPDNNQLDLINNYTLEAWIFPETFNWLGGILSKYQSSGANGYTLRLTDQSPYSGLGFDEKTTNTGVLNSNQWHHIAAVNNQGVRSIYIDGAEFNLSGSALNVSSNNNPIRIGSDYSSRFFDGRMDEIRIWNIARTQSEIQESMNTLLSGSEEGLVAYYTFNEGIGDTLYDQTGNGHDGRLFGNPNWVDGYTLSGLIGDINFDEIINIYDAVMLVSIMLGNEVGTPLQTYACDLNSDGFIDIEDIVMLIQKILTIDTTNRDSLSDATYTSFSHSIQISSNGEIAGFQINLKQNTILSKDNIPTGWSWNQKGNTIIAFSLDGTPLPQPYILPLEKPTEIEKINLVGWESKSLEAVEKILPLNFSLEAGPNPFNPSCNISFKISSSSNIILNVYNLNGQYLSSIFSGLLQEGQHHFVWKPFKLSSGTYFIKITDGKNSETLKTLYLK
ncbi:MAG: LamG-like jellyroll fold domain-containing protein [Fidelibacterota bacterium]